MAANWRHLSRLLGSRWGQTACRFRQLTKEPRDVLLRTSLPTSSTVLPSPWSTQCRAASANTVGTPEPPPGIMTRFWRWFNDEVEEEVMSEEEATARQDLLQRVQDMYFAKPPVTPSLDFYKEALTTLMKYNDGLGVDTLWNSMTEMQVEPDEELKARVEPFLEQARKRSWFE